MESPTLTRTAPGEVCAFFDFDKTLLAGDAGVIFGRSLGGYGYAQARRFRSRVARAAWHAYVTGRITGILAQEAFFRGLYSMKLLKRSALVTRGYRFLGGFPVADMHERMARVWDDVLSKRFYPQMLDVVEWHRRQGHRIVIVTTGLKDLVSHARKRLGEDVEIIAVEMLERDGVWTGRVKGPLWGVDKREAIREYAESRGVRLEESYAYSDHFSDYPFLEAVGNPVAVNPKRRLAKLAARRGWKILRVQPPTALQA